MNRIETFRARLRANEPMMGTFLKTPSPIICEVLGISPLACVCIDAEHAPFGRMEIDGCVAALRAADMPSLVRVQSGTAGEILTVLDAGASGVVLPISYPGCKLPSSRAPHTMAREGAAMRDRVARLAIPPSRWRTICKTVRRPLSSSHK